MSMSGSVLIELSRWWLAGSSRTFVIMFVLMVVLHFTRADDPHLLQNPTQGVRFHPAYLNISYMERETKRELFKKYEGQYGHNSIISSISGVVMHTISVLNKSGIPVTNNFGCTTYVNPKFPSEHWIALVEKGGDCTFATKIRIATKEHNASAVVMYSNGKTDKIYMNHDKDIPGISVLLHQADGKEIAHLIDMGYAVHMQIIPGPESIDNTAMQNSISKTSVLFVSISFIVLMIISLAWLVFYYIQRFRYSHAKERLARRLVCAAKKAIAKIPQRTVKIGDKELDSEFDQCAVCIEPYKAHDVIRILPCRHVFHKSCVDPWLLDQRSCPMCKLDILRAFGMQIGGSQESVHPDTEAVQVAAITQEPEISSSVEDTQTEEIKVLLVPHTCLHFRSGRDKVVGGDDDDASSSLLGTVGGTIPTSSSTSSLNSKGSRHYRAEKSVKAEGVSSEMKALIGDGNIRKGRWHSDEHNDEDEDIEANIVTDDEHIINAIETVMKEKVIEEDVEIGSMRSSSTLSLTHSLSSEQITNKPISSDDLSDSGKGNGQQDTNCDSLCQDTIVNVEFHEVNDDVDMESIA